MKIMSVEVKRIEKPRWIKVLFVEVNAVVNSRNGIVGLSPAQWAVGRQPRHAGEQGDDETRHGRTTLEERIDPTTEFAEIMRIIQEEEPPRLHYVKRRQEKEGIELET